jgi:hypothetical protein
MRTRGSEVPLIHFFSNLADVQQFGCELSTSRCAVYHAVEAGIWNGPIQLHLCSGTQHENTTSGRYTYSALRYARRRYNDVDLRLRWKGWSGTRMLSSGRNVFNLEGWGQGQD